MRPQRFDAVAGRMRRRSQGGDPPLKPDPPPAPRHRGSPTDDRARRQGWSSRSCTYRSGGTGRACSTPKPSPTTTTTACGTSTSAGSGLKGFRERKKRSDAEDSAEDLRLLYVALTRARSQVVAWWAPTTTTHAGALHPDPCSRHLSGPPRCAPAAATRFPTRSRCMTTRTRRECCRRRLLHSGIVIEHAGKTRETAALAAVGRSPGPTGNSSSPVSTARSTGPFQGRRTRRSSAPRTRRLMLQRTARKRDRLSGGARRPGRSRGRSGRRTR